MDYLALILAVGFTAIVVSIVLAWFRRGSGKHSFALSDLTAWFRHGNDKPPPALPELAEGKCFAKQYLQESVRLAELLIDQLDLAKSDLDKKGQLLAVFCVGALGFVLSEWKESASIEEMILYLATIPFLLAGLMFAARSLGLKNYGPKGLYPKIAIGKSVGESFKDIDGSKEKTELLLYRTLTQYSKKIATSERSNDVKVDDIKMAIGLIVIGAVSLISASLFPVFAEISSRIQAWACLLAGLWHPQFGF